LVMLRVRAQLTRTELELGSFKFNKGGSVDKPE
jgi:hypothetical protein